MTTFANQNAPHSANASSSKPTVSAPSSEVQTHATLSGLSEDFLRYGHEVSNLGCRRCRPEYPSICQCGGLIHSHLHDIVGSNRKYLFCCDHCGAAYKEAPDNGLFDDLFDDGENEN
jgi:hypothetical protein